MGKTTDRMIVNGVTYEIIDAASRAQIETMTGAIAEHGEDLTDIKREIQESQIYLVSESWTDGKYLDTDGSLQTLSSGSVSSFINVEGAQRVLITTYLRNGVSICKYDSSQNVIGYVRPSTASDWTLTTYEYDVSDASYVRFTCCVSYKDSAYVIIPLISNMNGIKGEIDELYELAGDEYATIPGWTSGKYVDRDGTLQTLNSASASDFVDVSKYAMVKVTSTLINGVYICFYDADYNVVGYIRSSASSWTSETYYINTIGVNYIRLSCATSYRDAANVVANVKQQIKALTDKVSGITDDINITLGQTYTTLISALTFAGTVANKDQWVNIYIPEGEHDAFSGIDLGSQTSDFRGLIVPDYVRIIGIGSPENTIIKAELPADMTGYAFARNSISTLNMWRNNSLKNLKIISKNMRYPVHNDKATSDENDYYEEHFENCYFLANGEPGVTADNIAFGSGMAKGAQLFFENCVFDSPMNPYMCANIHNRLNGKSPVTWSFKHCEFIGGQYSMLLTSYNSGQTDNLNFIGCKMDGKIIFQTALSSHQCDYKLFGAGNDLQGYVWNTSTEKPEAVAMMI